MGGESETPEKSPRQKVMLNDTTRIVVQSKAFCFSISRYKDYKPYALHPIYRPKDYGEK